MRYFIRLAYDGSKYHGWQIQPNAISVQQTLQDALSLMANQKIEVVGCGRTDTGVHAADYFAHFEAKALDIELMVHKLNVYLDNSIAIKGIYEVDDEAHARYDATSRSYQYRISPVKNPFTANHCYHFRKPLDLQAMNKAASTMLGEHDFASFSRSNTDVTNFLCTVTQCQWRPIDDELVLFISANRFLRNMVRAVTGTLLDVGLGKSTLENFQNIVAQKNRSAAGTSVPAHGLFLTEIRYPENLEKLWL